MLQPITFEFYFISFCIIIFTVTFLIIQNITVEKIPFNVDRLQKSLNPADMMLLVHPRQEQLGMLFAVLKHR